MGNATGGMTVEHHYEAAPMTVAPEYNDTHSHLTERLELVRQHIYRMAQNHGLFEELNEAIRLPVAANAKAGASALRFVCLMANLIAACALFAKPTRHDDVSFQLFSDAFTDAGFVEHLAITARTWLPDGLLADEHEATVREQITEFVRLLELCQPMYRAIKPMRDKTIAHLTAAEYPRPLVGHVLELTRNSIAMAEILTFILEGRDHTIKTIIDGSRAQVRSLMRVGARLRSE